MGWSRRLNFTSGSAVALAALLALSACGADSADDIGQDARNDEATVELMEDDEETAEVQRTVSIDVPDDWYEVQTKNGFRYQYLWEGNDWDDILAQNFDSRDFSFRGEFFVSLLEDSLGAKSTITVRDEEAELGSYPAIIVDVVYDSGSFTSLTYVNVEGRLWEFTVNSQTPEGLRRGEEINETAEFSVN